MAADIHAFIETKRNAGTASRNGGRTAKPWVFEKKIKLYRSYATFAMLADVRNYWGFRPVDEARGIPGGGKVVFNDRNEASVHCENPQESPSDKVKAEIEKNAEFSFHHSWLTLADLRKYDVLKAIEEIEKIDGPVIDKPGQLPLAWTSLVAAMEKTRQKYDLDDSQVRVVFFFDT